MGGGGGGGVGLYLSFFIHMNLYLCKPHPFKIPFVKMNPLLPKAVCVYRLL
jgi:hypothetical protein